MTATDVTSPRAQTREIDMPFTLERAEDGGDGLTFEGYAAVFNSPTDIRDFDGEYVETVAPGAFRKSLREKPPVLMFNHGRHPFFGDMPLGRITDIREDPRGLYVKARMSNNWMIEPVRDAIAQGSISGMSFRFEVVKDQWSTGPGGRRSRTLKEVKVPEVGPVVFPAYPDTTASVRSVASAAFNALTREFGADVIAPETRDDSFSTEDPDLRDLVSDAVEDLWALSDVNSDAYIIDLYDDYAVFTVIGRDNVKYPGLWRVGFTYANGEVSIDAPTKQQAVDYGANDNPASDMGTSTPAAYNSQEPEGATRMDSTQDLDTSNEAAATAGTSGEAVVRAEGLTREQTIRLIELQERGIRIPS